MLQHSSSMSNDDYQSTLKLINLICINSRAITDGNEGSSAADGSGKGAQSLKEAFALLGDYAANKVLLKLVPLPG